MAEVPYSPIPNATEHFEAAPEPHIATPGAAFGETIGRAISGMGDKTEQVGNELFTRAIAMQDLHNQAMSDQSVTEYMQKLAQLHANFTSQNGQNAGPAALAKYGQDIAGLRTQVRQNLDNPMAQRYYDRETLSTMGRTFFNAAQHSGEQMQQFALGSLASKNEATRNMVISNPSDANVAAAERDDATYAKTMGQIKGQNTDTVGVNTAKLQSATHYTQVQSLITAGKVPEAKALIEKYRGSGGLVGLDLENADKLYTSKMLTTVAARAAATVNAKMPNASPLEKAAAVKDEISKMVPKDDPNRDMYIEGGENKIRSDIAVDEALKRQDSAETVSTLENGLINAAQAGKTITDVEQLRGLGTEYSDAIDKLTKEDPSKVLELQKKIKTIAAAATDDKWTPEREANFNRLTGMALADGNNFKQMELATENLTIDQHKALQDKKMALLKGQRIDDPHISAALHDKGVLQIMRDNGISTNPSDTENQKFQGAMQQEIQALMISGKAPSSQEYQELANKIVQYNSHPDQWHIYSPSTWGPKGTQTMILDEDGPKPEIAKQIQARPIWGGRIPTDAEVNSYYRTMLWNQIQKNKASE